MRVYQAAWRPVTSSTYASSGGLGSIKVTSTWTRPPGCTWTWRGAIPSVIMPACTSPYSAAPEPGSGARDTPYLMRRCHASMLRAGLQVTQAGAMHMALPAQRSYGTHIRSLPHLGGVLPMAATVSQM
jgi:hypothetical protein